MDDDEAREPLMAAASGESARSREEMDSFPTQPPVKVFKCGRYHYPFGVLFIIGNEFCERFSYYGLRTILIVYFTQYLMMDEHTSTALFHAFTMLCYFSPILGAIVADGWLGRYRTILYVSAIYAVGNVMMAFTAIPPPESAGPLIALLIIAVCTGGIKPCVSAFGGDQFDAVGQEKELSAFFSAFYFSINGGSLISTFLTPILRAEVKCFGYSSCYPLAFGVPAALMFIALAFFFGGRKMYRHLPPSGNVIGKFVTATTSALKNRWLSRTKHTAAKEHWLHYADSKKFEMSFLQDMRAVYQVLFMFLPLPFFWALFDQQGSRWTIQASKMDSSVGSWSIQPDQMQILNPLLVLVLIPIFESVIYPLMDRLKIPSRPLQRMVAGMLFAVLAFVAAGVIQMKMEDSTDSDMRLIAQPQTAFLNAAPCRVNISGVGQQTSIDKMQVSPWLMWDDENKIMLFTGDCFARHQWNMSASVKHGAPADSRIVLLSSPLSSGGNAMLQVDAYSCLPPNGSEVLPAGRSHLCFLLPSTLMDIKTISLVPTTSGGDGTSSHTYDFPQSLGESEKIVFNAVDRGSYSVNIYGSRGKLSVIPAQVTLGGATTVVYAILPPINGSLQLSAVTLPGAGKGSQKVLLPIALQIPQYLLITIGEVMFSVTGLSFSYSQAPASMKSVLTAAWLLTVAFGNLIVMVVAEAAMLPQFAEFFLFAGLMLLDTCIFAAMAVSYKYRLPSVAVMAAKSSEPELADSCTVMDAVVPAEIETDLRAPR